ncbi:MAG: hypothetical protein HYZ52_04750 [Candidatus Omnitrophica bacterium]|nr:hypothetical protein [Candidatus Omnitrophota bacterium]
MRRPVTAFLVGTILALAAGEAVLSQCPFLIDNPPGQFKRSRTRAFQHVPYFHGKDRYGHPIRLNSRGYRDKEYSFDKLAGVYRILVLGDSVAFGDGVAVEDAFPDQLEDLLNEAGPSGRKIEVINTGIRGYNTVQEFLLLKEEGLGYNPDLVLLCYVDNDAEPFSNQDGLIDKRNEWLIAAKDFIKRHSYLYAFFRKNFEVMRHRVTPEKFNEHYSDQFRPDHPGWSASYRALEAIQKITRERGIGFLLAVYPELVGTAPDEKYPDDLMKIQRQVLEAGRSLSIDTLDLLPAIQGHDARELRIAPNDWFHPNRRGHRLVAEAVSRAVREKYLSIRTNHP